LASEKLLYLFVIGMIVLFHLKFVVFTITFVHLLIIHKF